MAASEALDLLCSHGSALSDLEDRVGEGQEARAQDGVDGWITGARPLSVAVGQSLSCSRLCTSQFASAPLHKFSIATAVASSPCIFCLPPALYNFCQPTCCLCIVRTGPDGLHHGTGQPTSVHANLASRQADQKLGKEPCLNRCVHN